MGKKKFYVVWIGKTPGIYDTWDDCKAQVEGYPHAQYKSFSSLDLAKEAFRIGPEMSLNISDKVSLSKSVLTLDENGLAIVKGLGENDPKPELNALAVDAACSGNPGVMEYRGVFVASLTQLFHFKSPVGTNNIGEFLGIVHGLAFLKKNHMDMIIYSDSVNAINWVKAKKCRTKLPMNEQTSQLFSVIQRAETWLLNNSYSTEIRKWNTELWGEIPADFGRK